MRHVSFTALLLIAAVCNGAEPLTPPLDEALRQAHQAYEESSTNILSGTAAGTWRVWDAGGELCVSARLVMVFSRERVNLKLDFDALKYPKFPAATKRDLIWDSETIAFTRFWHQILPAGCEYEVHRMGRESMQIASGGLALDPSRLHKKMVVLSGENYVNPRIDRLSDDVLRITSTDKSGNIRYSCDVKESAESHVVRVAVFDERASHELLEQIADWDLVDGVWCVRRCQWKNWIPKKAGYERNEIEFTRFEPNVPLSDAEFTLSSLDSCGSSRVIDRRPGVEEPIKIAAFNSSTASNDSIGDQIDSLPRRTIPNASPAPPIPDIHWQVRVIVGVNALVIAIVTGLVVRCRLSQRSAVK